ncbi:bifunctional diaminohydroxyphosphoribosylaminopyrimidine deaminase/5-amino-6-(5-phosphoribosylamino)uracil reductase RibD [Sporosarcina trichiuri]|uniref:bifunctional diaminohydroxyphosphoribosylaminopyrimidine deaminase/5-amino-6-(5-phosphoribosylamino)uracil reductase RibD n=1 Tax=Sporosarcina trichiuri TaxID=3056445 RepID=UPI0025B5C803|nr:bifunctional diaminohydroxyphosphoribosylaminopyrimidine deaminase/5-amino-6-(5-phosphoribosylamino)uracil reductase RibD [Sporosarcina sp. 0.2-SM1T-5]WJY26851.1 bifunctional diaminohydroxyphosphoribosylaminopyrimidine deaminase/5-amino-6-(5-phosphoribosylamino)uracil reductase RibD [Sporosarcina sp. 0.2-SM1T-5]
MDSEQYMQLAFSLAAGAAGQTSPNPPVGAVVVKDGRILGMGAHLQAGGPHAERVALDMAGPAAEGADLYVTLEPCSHTGKTPPCTEAVLAAGVRRVYLAAQDPNPLISGSGIRLLTEAGLDVRTGVCESAAQDLYAPFFHFIRTKQPHVTIKTAMTLDGKIAASSGHSQWVTSGESRLDVQSLRHAHDAILCGVNTILHDNPLLTARLPQGGLHPIRVILDTQLKTPLDCRLLLDNSAPVWIFCGCDAPSSKEDALAEVPHAEVIRLPEPEVAIPAVLKELGARGIVTLLVEGGAAVNASFLSADAVDRIIAYVAPKLLGGSGSLTPVGGRDPLRMDEAAEFEFREFEQIGPDLKVTAVRKGRD